MSFTDFSKIARICSAQVGWWCDLPHHMWGGPTQRNHHGRAGTLGVATHLLWLWGHFQSLLYPTMAEASLLKQPRLLFFTGRRREEGFRMRFLKQLFRILEMSECVALFALRSGLRGQLRLPCKKETPRWSQKLSPRKVHPRSRSRHATKPDGFFENTSVRVAWNRRWPSPAPPSSQPSIAVALASAKLKVRKWNEELFAFSVCNIPSRIRVSDPFFVQRYGRTVSRNKLPAIFFGNGRRPDYISKLKYGVQQLPSHWTDFQYRKTYNFVLLCTRIVGPHPHPHPGKSAVVMTQILKEIVDDVETDLCVIVVAIVADAPLRWM